MRIFRCLWLLSAFLLLILFTLGSHSVAAQQLAPAKITSFQITTIDGKPVTDATLMAGATYKVDFTIEVADGLKDQCVLKTSLIRASGLDHFWTLNGSYPGIDTSTWQPGQSTITFNAVAGTAQMELEGSVPADYVSESLPDGQNLHLSKKISIVDLSLGSGAVIADNQLEVIDSSIEGYRNALSTKQQLLTSMAADPGYTDLVKALVADAEAEAGAGRIDLAMNTLNAIPTSGWVKPQGSTYYQWIIIGILAILLAVLVFLLMRTRSEINFLRRQTDSHAKSLQILAKKASRIGDSTLTAGIEQVRKELEESLGGS